MHRSTQLFAGALLALLCAYVVVYFAFVRIGGGAYSSRFNRFELSPNYHGLPSELFIPIHLVDRKALRPHLWSYAGTPEEYARQMGWVSP